MLLVSQAGGGQGAGRGGDIHPGGHHDWGGQGAGRGGETHPGGGQGVDGEELSNLPELTTPLQHPDSSVGVSGSSLCGVDGGVCSC